MAASIYVPQSSVVSVEPNRRLGKKEYWFVSLPRCQDQFEVQSRHVGDFLRCEFEYEVVAEHHARHRVVISALRIDKTREC